MMNFQMALANIVNVAGCKCFYFFCFHSFYRHLRQWILQPTNVQRLTKTNKISNNNFLKKFLQALNNKDMCQKWNTYSKIHIRWMTDGFWFASLFLFIKSYWTLIVKMIKKKIIGFTRNKKESGIPLQPVKVWK